MLCSNLYLVLKFEPIFSIILFLKKKSEFRDSVILELGSSEAYLDELFSRFVKIFLRIIRLTEKYQFDTGLIGLNKSI